MMSIYHEDKGSLNNMDLKILYVDIYSPATPFKNNDCSDSDHGNESDDDDEVVELEDPLMVKPAPPRLRTPVISILSPARRNKPGRPNTFEALKFCAQPKSAVATNISLKNKLAHPELANANITPLKRNVKEEIAGSDSPTVLPFLDSIEDNISTEEMKLDGSRERLNDEFCSDTNIDSDNDKFCLDTIDKNPAYKCDGPNCFYTASTKKALNSHKRKVHQCFSDYKCDQCNYETATASSLRKHYRLHSGELPYACPYVGCNYRGKHSNYVEYHKRKVHPAGDPLRCEYMGCLYQTRFPPSLKIHTIKKHSGEKTIACELCPYRCYLIGELRKHSLCHSTATPYACDFPGCGYACKISSNLKKHKRIHTEERPYACDQCAFRSNFISSLKAHKRIHTDERPYCCEQCGYRCNSASNLKKHISQRHPGTVYAIAKKSKPIFITDKVHNSKMCW